MNATNLIPLTYENAFYEAIAIIGFLLSCVWASLRWSMTQQLKRVEKIEADITAIRDTYVLKDHIASTEKDVEKIDIRVEKIEKDYVSKGELKEMIRQLDKSISDSGLSVRDALARVHVRIDDIYKELYSSKGQK